MTKIDPNKSIEEQLEGTPDQPKKLSRKEREALDRKKKSFTETWKRLDFQDTQKALCKEASRQVGYMERWRDSQLEEDRKMALMSYAGSEHSEFPKIKRAINYRNEIYRKRHYIQSTWSMNLTVAQDKLRLGTGTEEDVQKIIEEKERIEEFEIPGLCFRIYKIWCDIVYTVVQDTDKRQALNLSTYEEYNYEENM